MKTERFDPVNVPYSKAMIKDEHAEDQKARIKLLSEGYEDLEVEKKERTNYVV